MKDSLRHKLENLHERHEELSALLSSPNLINQQEQFRAYSKEYAQLEPVVTCFCNYLQAQANLDSAKKMLEDQDPELRLLAEEEYHNTQQHITELEYELQILLLPSDPNDERNVFLEIRAGTGGNEAAIFAGDMARMYLRYAEERQWQTEIMSANPGEHGGYKEIIIKINGNKVYSYLKFESGAHRVQRVPVTEAQGRIHTSACTVAILPEVEEVDEIDINPADLKVDTYRASGAGGQHVNKTDSAIRITHLPTGLVVECQEERSQHKNRAKALSLLHARLLQAEQQRQHSEQAQMRKSLVGSGDRSERIRTYNFPQSRITDHRINLTLYKLPEIMEGHLEQIIDPLVREYQAELLATLGQ